jgi:catechol 2,3-dioxygenase-like lactoylglutathione lyase family enzyme
MKRLVILLLALACGTFYGEARELSVGPIGVTVSDMDRAVAFYTKVLAFRKVSDREFHDPGADALLGLFGARMRVVDLRLGDETLELTEFRNIAGRPIPPDSQSNDLWFQHIAIVVRDMDAAAKRLAKFRVRPTSVAPQRLPDWNPNAGGIRAFYFRDPDNHNLEVIFFPPGKGDPRWQRNRSGLFLGIDHTAIVVSDTERSLRFYRDRLGLRVAGTSHNWGIEQEYLNHMRGARLRITSLRGSSGPGVELLQYEQPGAGRSIPADETPADIAHWQPVLRSSEWLGPSHLVRDPDGHALLLSRP